ncbi:epimerase [Luteolibacter sp. Populi]|uniref:epimerase n=1 Tax=Luteolibacter sp. Populi TaxID=3230487 RepID=UPI00346748D3
MNRRDSLKLAAVAGVSSFVPSVLAQAAAPAPGPLRILILGGTGFTGPHQVRYALARGHKLTLFNRGRRPKEWPGEVEELVGDRDKNDYKALEGREWDVCIDNPTSVPFWVRDAGKVLAGKVKQYIFISTVSVYADTSKPGMDETTALHTYEGPDAMAETNESMRANMALYGPLKAASEREAEKQFPGITTILRPTLIVGPGDETDRFTYWPARIQKGGEVLAPPPADPVQIIDARDLAEWTIRMAEQRSFGAFNACGPDYELGMGAMLYGIRAVTTAGAKFTFVSADFLQEQKVAPWGHLPVWVPGQGDSAGFARTSIAKSLAAGLSFRSLATTTADTLEWFNALPAERRAKLRAGISAEREAALLKSWHEKDK